MRFETAFICEREHLVIDTSGVPDAQDVNASIYQFLRDAVYGGITLGANDHLILPVKGLVNGFHQGGCFPSSGRAVYDRYLFRSQYLIYGFFLRTVQPREADRK